MHAPAFDGDLSFDEAVAMMNRLETEAAKRGRTVGAKFTNTLVVENHKAFFSPDQKQMYLSGPPLHVLAVQAAARFAEATDGRFALSFSGGIERTNFVDTLACGFVPVTTCTDLLRPGGYGRLPKYLKELEARMETAGVRDVASFVRAQAGGIDDPKQLPRCRVRLQLGERSLLRIVDPAAGVRDVAPFVRAQAGGNEDAK